jgi:hypothetical protein
MKRMEPSTVSNLVNADSMRASSISVDEIRDLMSPTGVDLCESPWKLQNFPRESILWPNSLLDSYRENPMHPSVKDRLVSLWSTSSSHGVSWDELDEAFLVFHRGYIQKETEFTEKYPDLWNREYAESERVLRASCTGDEAQVNTVLHRRRGKIRRMTHTRMSRLRFKEVVKPFHMRRFTEYMRSFVTPRIIKREEIERKFRP